MFGKKNEMEIDNYLMELREHFKLYVELSNRPIPDTPSPYNATEENMRKSLLDQRAYYIDMKKPFELIDSTLDQLDRVWYEGREPVRLLKDWSKNFQQLFDNNIEENKLWESPEPMGSGANKRRQEIFEENRKLEPKTNDLFRKAAEKIYNLRGVNIIEWLS